MNQGIRGDCLMKKTKGKKSKGGKGLQRRIVQKHLGPRRKKAFLALVVIYLGNE
jgi:hypothetical protein